MAVLSLSIDSRGALAGAGKYVAASRKVTTASTRMDKSVRKVDKSMKKLSGSAGGLKRVVGGLFLGFGAVAGIKSAISTIVDYEDTMQTVLAVSRASTRQFAEMSEVARELGATTRFSAKEAGEGMLFLARAGFDANQNMLALPHTLNLAAAGAIALGEAADISSNILSAFGLNASEMEKVVDSMVHVANSANTSVTELGQAMVFVAPLAGALGFSVEETAAAIGVLGDSGIKATMAGTSLRGMLTTLLGPTKKATDALKQAGVNIADLSPESNTLVEVIQKLAEANLGAEKSAAIFGRRIVSGALTVTKYNEKLARLTREIGEMAGITKETAGIMSDDLEGSWKSLISVSQELALQLGDGGIKGGLRGILDFSTDVFRVLAGMEDHLIGTGDAAEHVANAIKAAGVSIGVYITVLGIAKFATLALATANGTLIVSLLANPYTAIAVAVGVLALALFELRDQQIKLGTETVTVGNLVWATWQQMVNNIKGVFQTLNGILIGTKAAFLAIGVAAETMANTVKTQIDVLRRNAQTLANVYAFFTLQTPRDFGTEGAETAGRSAGFAWVEGFKNAAIVSFRGVMSGIATAGNFDTIGQLAAARAREQEIALATLELGIGPQFGVPKGFVPGGDKDDSDEGVKELTRLEIAVNSVGDAFSQTFEQILTGTETMTETFKSLVAEIQMIFFRALVLQPVSTAVTGLVSATGTALQTALTPRTFASGGVVTSPTTFPMGGRRVGMMGESGPEAIIPLTRGADGRLGVGGGNKNVTVNMNVYSPNVDGFRRSGDQILRLVTNAAGRV